MTAAAIDLFAPFGGELTRLAGLELLVVGVACGALGVWVVQLGRAFLTESLSHALLPGLVVGSLTGIGLLAGAALGTAVAFFFNAAASRAPRTSPSAGTSIAVTTLVGIGALLAQRVDGAGLLEDLLFGNPLAVERSGILASAVLVSGVALALWLLRRPLAAFAFDPSASGTFGVNVVAVEWVFLALLSLTVAASAFVVGSLLAPALLTGPALGARALGVRATAAPFVGAAVGGVCGLAGVYLSYLADLPVSASVALCCTVAAALPALYATVAKRSATSAQALPLAQNHAT
ncbi:MAG: metal ABC transporter permease [Thermoleophilaceae bacterium]|nr:metal ABC transporter permease [Thermoleophilaceae bacterium]